MEWTKGKIIAAAAAAVAIVAAGCFITMNQLKTGKSGETLTELRKSGLKPESKLEVDWNPAGGDRISFSFLAPEGSVLTEEPDNNRFVITCEGEEPAYCIPISNDDVPGFLFHATEEGNELEWLDDMTARTYIRDAGNTHYEVLYRVPGSKTTLVVMSRSNSDLLNVISKTVTASTSDSKATKEEKAKTLRDINAAAVQEGRQEAEVWGHRQQKKRSLTRTATRGAFLFRRIRPCIPGAGVHLKIHYGCPVIIAPLSPH